MRNLRYTLAAVLAALPLAIGTGCAPGELDQLINTLSTAVAPSTASASALRTSEW